MNTARNTMRKTSTDRLNAFRDSAETWIRANVHRLNSADLDVQGMGEMYAACCAELAVRGNAAPASGIAAGW